MFSTLKKFLSPEELEVRNSQRVDGVGADTMLRTLSPLIERRQEELLIKLFAAPPQLEVLLDLIAQLREVTRIHTELKSVKELGKEAGEALGEIFS